MKQNKKYHEKNIDEKSVLGGKCKDQYTFYQ